MSTEAAKARGGLTDADHPNRRWWILAVLATAQLMVVLDVTVINIALPSAQQALGFSDAERQWVITSYSLAFGSLLLAGGRLSDIIGRRQTFLIGAAGFALASAVGGASQSFGMLVAARATQGAFAALLAPSALALLTTTFRDPASRGKAFSVYGSVSGAGAAIGLLLGGFLTEYLSWRWCLYVNLFFAAVAVVGGVLLLARQAPDRTRRFDLPGSIAVGAGLFCIVYGLSHAESAGWSSPVTVGFLVVGVVLLFVFVLVERIVPQPLLPLRIELDRNRGGAQLGLMVAGVGMFGIFLFLSYYMSTVLGFSAVQSGLGFIPLVLGLVAGSTISSTLLLPRVGPKPLVPAGMLIAAGGLLYLSRLSELSTYANLVLPALLIIGPGIGIIVATSVNTATTGLNIEDAGVGSAMVNTCQQIGGATGTALLSTVAATATANYLAGKQSSSEVIASANLAGFSAVFETAAIIFAVGALVCGLLLRPGPPAPIDGAVAAAVTA